MGFIILLIRVITHADFQVIAPGAGKSMASQIAANGTSQTPVGHSLVAQRAISGSSSASGGSHHARSCSTSDISDGSDTPKNKYYRKRMYSTGNTSALARSNNNLLPPTTNSSTSSTKPIVINNYHHLHLHCHRSNNVTSGHVSAGHNHRRENSLTDTPSGTEGMSPVSEITLVNEVQPLLPSSPPIIGPGPRNQRLGPT